VNPNEHINLGQITTTSNVNVTFKYKWNFYDKRNSVPQTPDYIFWGQLKSFNLQTDKPVGCAELHFTNPTNSDKEDYYTPNDLPYSKNFQLKVTDCIEIKLSATSLSDIKLTGYAEWHWDKYPGYSALKGGLGSAPINFIINIDNT
jgi:hypothetical protein